MNRQRIATNGDIRLEATPGQWQPVPKQLSRKLTTMSVAALIGLAATVSAQNVTSRLMQHESQIDGIIAQMTLEEKVAMLHGKNMFSSAGVPRLGIADIEYADGPFGIREEMEPHSWNSAHLVTDSATFFPTGSALAATDGSGDGSLTH